MHNAPSSRSAHTSLGQLTPGTLKLFAEKLFWLLHETSSFFQPCLPVLVEAACCWAGWDAEPIHPPWGAPPALAGLTCPTEALLASNL